MLLIAVVLRILEYDYVVALSSVHDDDADNGSSSGETRSNWCCRPSCSLSAFELEHVAQQAAWEVHQRVASKLHCRTDGLCFGKYHQVPINYQTTSKIMMM